MPWYLTVLKFIEVWVNLGEKIWIDLHNSHGIRWSRALTPSSDANNLVARFDKTLFFAVIHGILNTSVNILSPILDAILSVVKRNNSTVKLKLSGNLRKSGDSHNRAFGPVFSTHLGSGARGGQSNDSRGSEAIRGLNCGNGGGLSGVHHFVIQNVL